MVRAVRSGQDPITTRKEFRRSQRHLLREVALECFEARKAELRGGGLAGRWFSPLDLHVLPRLGATPVTQIGQVAIRDALAALWREKPVTAGKALERLGIVLKHAAAMGLDVGQQATMKAKLLLGALRGRVRHIPALPWTEVPGFYASLGKLSPTHLALRRLILTGVRSSPLRRLHLAQIDAKDRIWTIPADQRKGRVGQTAEFRVPLSAEAMSVIDLASPLAHQGLLFPGTKGSPISDMALSMFMRRAGLEARPHGFRTSPSVWLAEQTDTSREVAETILAHTVGGKVERACRRTDYLEQRRDLMERWAGFVAVAPTRLSSTSNSYTAIE